MRAGNRQPPVVNDIQSYRLQSPRTRGLMVGSAPSLSSLAAERTLLFSLFFLCVYVCVFSGTRGGGFVDPPEGARSLTAEDERALGVEGEERWRPETPAGRADRLAQVSARSLPGKMRAKSFARSSLILVTAGKTGDRTRNLTKDVAGARRCVLGGSLRTPPLPIFVAGAMFRCIVKRLRGDRAGGLVQEELKLYIFTLTHSLGD